MRINCLLFCFKVYSYQLDFGLRKWEFSAMIAAILRFGKPNLRVNAPIIPNYL